MSRQLDYALAAPNNVMRLGLIAAVVLILALSAGAAAGTYSEAPMLQELVEAGELPAVEDRLPHPDHVYVVEPLEEIGRYGGTLRTTTVTPEGYGDDTLLSSYGNAVQPAPDGTETIPHILRDLEHSEDRTVWTMHLRQGMKWSDGVPLTSEDLMFWYNDILLNEDLTPVIGVPWRWEGEVVQAVQIDDYTVEFSMSTPQVYFAEHLLANAGLFRPKHYLKQFHPNYVDQDELEAMVQDSGHDHWYQLFLDKDSNVWGKPLNPDRPGLTTYVLDERTADRRVWVRNPYYWKVDTEGNQLPYVDRIDAEIISDMEVAQGMIMSGALDFAGQQTDIRNYPMYRASEEEANVRTLMWTSAASNDVVYFFNMTHEDPAMREIFQDVRFRQAMSLAIDRDELNEVIYYGQAVPRQYTAPEESMYFEPEFATAYAEFDPGRAAELLDEMGLDEKDSEGYRLRPDGERLVFTVEFYDIETPKLPNVELVAEYWREVGVDARYRAISGELQSERASANLMDATLWHGANTTDIHFPIYNFYIIPISPGWEHSQWPEWARYFQTEGREGEEPPEKVKQVRAWYEEMLVNPDDDRREELGKNLFRAQAENLWNVGTVGRAPYVVVINENIRNFAETGLWVWDTKWSMSRDPGQIFFAE